MSHYELLGVMPDAGVDEIHQAYRRAASRAHPDREGGSAARMAELAEAWRVLRDPGLRAGYDMGVALKPVEEEARDNLLSLVVKALDENYADVIGRCTDIVRESIANHEGQRIMMKGRLASLRARVGRVKRRTPGFNLIEATVQQQIGQLQTTLEKIDYGLAVHRAALTLLADHGFAEDIEQESMSCPEPAGTLSEP